MNTIWYGRRTEVSSNPAPKMCRPSRVSLTPDRRSETLEAIAGKTADPNGKAECIRRAFGDQLSKFAKTLIGHNS